MAEPRRQIDLPIVLIAVAIFIDLLFIAAALVFFFSGAADGIYTSIWVAAGVIAPPLVGYTGYRIRGKSLTIGAGVSIATVIVMIALYFASASPKAEGPTEIELPGEQQEDVIREGEREVTA